MVISFGTKEEIFLMDMQRTIKVDWISACISVKVHEPPIKTVKIQREGNGGPVDLYCPGHVHQRSLLLCQI